MECRFQHTLFIVIWQAVPPAAASCHSVATCVPACLLTSALDINLHDALCTCCSTKGMKKVKMRLVQSAPEHMWKSVGCIASSLL